MVSKPLHSMRFRRCGVNAVDHVAGPWDSRAKACQRRRGIQREGRERLEEEDFVGEEVSHLVVQGASRRAFTRLHGERTSRSERVARCWRRCGCRRRHYLTFL